MLHEFLKANQNEILAACDLRASELGGLRVKSDELKTGMPIFFEQLMTVLEHIPVEPDESAIDRPGMVRAANASDEPGIARAAGHPFEAEVATAAGAHGSELQMRGYTLSHVVHAYGSMCQAITEQCGGLRTTSPDDLFRAFEQHDKDREGLGLGLTIAHRAITLNHGTIEVENFPDRGCIFRIRLPNASARSTIEQIVFGAEKKYTRKIH